MFAIHQANPVERPIQHADRVRGRGPRHAGAARGGRARADRTAREPAHELPRRATASRSQRIHADGAVHAARASTATTRLDELMQRLMQPFDLAVAPLWRVWLVRRADGSELLVVDMHHIIADGYATAILWREVSEHHPRRVAAAAADHVRRLRAVAARATSTQRDARGSSARSGSRSSRDALPAPLAAAVRLPPPGGAQPRRRPRRRAAADATSSRALVALSRAHGSTLFATLLAAWFVFLSRIGGSDDVVVGVPVVGPRAPRPAGRRRHVRQHRAVARAGPDDRHVPRLPRGDARDVAARARERGVPARGPARASSTCARCPGATRCST